MGLCKSFAIAALIVCFNTIPVASAKSTAGESTPVSTRDWKLHPAIVELPETADVYALGDVHGDCDRMVQLLAGAKLIAAVPATSQAVKWSGGKADLIVTGDMIDKYDQSLRVIAVLRVLQPQVDAAGGHLVICLGNHEAEFLASGGDDKKGAEFEKELQAAGISPGDVAAGRDSGGIGAWLRDLPAGAKVGDWFFCHAGNTGGKKLAGLETELQQALEQIGFSTPLLIDPNSMLEARMHPRPWFDATSDPGLKDVKPPSVPETKKERKKTEKEEKKEEKKEKSQSSAAPPKLVETVQALGVKHLVIGHQPGKATFSDGTVRKEGQMFEHYNGMFFMIDTGMSRGVSSGRGAVLHIHAGKSKQSATAIYADSQQAELWKQ
ncbi:MAG TPA: metallophosphoesterase [Tepidisphaeraceae bacterium]|jgi:hypothetical protein|nr:metallophosphoesterase [Tepidisphaeraceae bacterium]